MQCQAGARGCQGWRSEERIGEGLALLGLEAGGHRGKGGCEAECGGSVKAEGGREEVGSAKGAVGMSQCQLGAGGLGKGRELSPYAFSRSCFVLQEKQIPLLVSCKTQEFQVQRALWGHFFKPFLRSDGNSEAHSGGLAFPKLPESLVTQPGLNLPMCTGLCYLGEQGGELGGEGVPSVKGPQS